MGEVVVQIVMALQLKLELMLYAEHIFGQMVAKVIAMLHLME